MNTTRPQPVTGVFRKFAHACETLTTEMVVIATVSLRTATPIAFTGYSLIKLVEVLIGLAANPAHAAELGDIIDAVMPKIVHSLFELAYEAVHTDHDWRTTRLKFTEYRRLAKVERRRLKYMWRSVCNAAIHAVKVLRRFMRMKSRRIGLLNLF